jgi:NADH-quinone oxidoreductase subunit C
MNAKAAAAAINQEFGDVTEKPVEFRAEFTVSVAPGSLHDVLAHCKDKLGFDYLVDISSLDHLGEEPRFEMVYELYSYEHGTHLRIKSGVGAAEREVPTVTDLWATANWHEREVYDMMGISFKGHPDLRRILMWEGFPFYPLRKDFPLAGKPSEMPDVAFSNSAPLAGGPFVTSPTGGDTQDREPRSREME